VGKDRPDPREETEKIVHFLNKLTSDGWAVSKFELEYLMEEIGGHKLSSEAIVTIKMRHA
jgi:hypothetical protein